MLKILQLIQLFLKVLLLVFFIYPLFLSHNRKKKLRNLTNYKYIHATLDLEDCKCIIILPHLYTDSSPLPFGWYLKATTAVAAATATTTTTTTITTTICNLIWELFTTLFCLKRYCTQTYFIGLDHFVVYGP